jgi:hemoglobin
MEQSLYNKYGGFSKVNRIVMAFYDGLLDSDEIGPYFDHIDMNRQIDHQTKFVVFLLGGPAHFAPDHLQRVHEGLKITDLHFDELKVIFGRTLENSGFSLEDTNTVLDIIESYRNQVVAE